MAPAPIQASLEDKHQVLQATLHALTRDLKQAKRKGSTTSIKKIDGKEQRRLFTNF